MQCAGVCSFAERVEEMESKKEIPMSVRWR